eukprot:m.253918 g.253918  ORF g.253918 m.253918 type:complete len:1412 (+) comp26724_c1_seq1:3775-8010(+)
MGLVEERSRELVATLQQALTNGKTKDADICLEQLKAIQNINKMGHSFVSQIEHTVLKCARSLEVAKERCDPGSCKFHAKDMNSLHEYLEYLKNENFAKFDEKLRALSTRAEQLLDDMQPRLKANFLEAFDGFLQFMLGVFEFTKLFPDDYQIDNARTVLDEGCKLIKTCLSSMCVNLEQGNFSMSLKEALKMAQDIQSCVDKLELSELNDLLDKGALTTTFTQRIDNISQILNMGLHELDTALEQLETLDIFAGAVPVDEIGKYLDVLRRQLTITTLEPRQRTRLETAQTKFRTLISTAPHCIRSLWLDHKFDTIICGYKNLKSLAASPNLQHLAVCQGAIQEVQQFIQTEQESMKAAIRAEFDKQKQTYQPNFKPLNEMMERAELHDRTFHHAHPESFPESLLEQIVVQFGEQTAQVIKTSASMRGSKELSDHSSVIVKLKAYIENISNVQVQTLVNEQIGGFIAHLYQQKVDFYELGNALAREGHLGLEVVESFPEFQAVRTEKHNQRTAAITIDHALDGFKEQGKTFGEPVSDTAIDTLRELYNKFSTTFDSYLEEYLTGLVTKDLSTLVQNIKKQSQEVSAERDYAKIRTAIPTLLAGLFAAWTIHTSGDAFRKTRPVNPNVLIKPHPVQIVAIFRLLSVEAKAEGMLGQLKSFVSSAVSSITGGRLLAERLAGHLVQVGTGEGKSILLGGLSCLLALLGYRVSCACYSKHLSERDYKAFEPLFKLFQVESLIRYSTLSALAEQLINEQGDIRQHTLARLKGEAVQVGNTHANQTPRILLIDEVDVFFQEEFFSSTFNPAASYQSPAVEAIIKHIWNNRDKQLHLKDIKSLDTYTQLTKEVPKEAQQILDRELRQVLRAVSNVNDPPYIVVDKEHIGYKTLDTVDTKRKFGYRTMFAYLSESLKGEINPEAANKQLHLNIFCGAFSFLELVRRFNCILGVTGTLSCLSEAERKIVKKSHNIKHFSYSPSIYGKSKLNFKERDDIAVEEDYDRFSQKVLQSIQERSAQGQPVLVFFENEEQIHKFLASDYGQRCPSPTVVTEATLNIDFYIKKATTTGQVTLMPKIFARGLDFACLDPNTQAAGGLHVIQAFFSNERAEEIQTKGRTARQSQKGSYEMVLLRSALTRFNVTEEQIEEEFKGNKFYKFLDEARIKLFEEHVKALEEGSQVCTDRHTTSMEYLECLRASQFNQQEFFEKLSKLSSILPSSKATLQVNHTDILLCIDTSGSMRRHFEEAKAYAMKMLELYNIGMSANRCGIVQFDDKVYTLTGEHNGITTCLTDDLDCLQHRIDTMVNTRGRTDFGKPMQECKRVFADEAIPNESRSCIIIFQTDGGAPTQEAEKISQEVQSELGCTVIGVVVGTEGLDNVRTFVGDPRNPNRSKESLCLLMDSYESLVEEAEQIVALTVQ